jgi:hypothetical protein
MLSYSVKRVGTLLVAYLTGITVLIVVIAMLGTTVAHQVIAPFDPSWGKSSGGESLFNFRMDERKIRIGRNYTDV